MLHNHALRISEINGKMKVLVEKQKRYLTKRIKWKLQNWIQISKIKNSLDWLNSRMEITEKRVRELEDRSIEIIQFQQRRVKRLEETNRVPRTSETIQKGLIFVLLDSQKERRVWCKKFLKKWWLTTSQN